MKTEWPERVNSVSDSLEQMRRALAEYEAAAARMTGAERELDSAFRSALSDLTLLPKLYGWYCETACANHFTGDARNGNLKQFVFIVLLLYAPRSLYGGTISRGLRREIAALLRFRSPTIVYYMRDTAVAWSGVYGTFRTEITEAYDAITSRLNENKPTPADTNGGI